MEKVQLLLRQHVGAPCAPCVAVGDKVKKGTLIATPTGLGANIFSSVYGEVSEILEDRIVIKADAEQPDEFVPIDVPEDASKLDMIKAAGIVGMGGAGFPTGILTYLLQSRVSSERISTQSFHKTSNWSTATF